MDTSDYDNMLIGQEQARHDNQGDLIVCPACEMIIGRCDTTEADNLRVECDDLRAQLEEIRDLARTGLAPDALNMTAERWLLHKLSEIAALADQAVKRGEG